MVCTVSSSLESHNKINIHDMIAAHDKTQISAKKCKTRCSFFRDGCSLHELDAIAIS